MSDVWRRKTYYDKRVLIDTERILDTSFPEILLCLTGAQVEMLRNLTQYLHRRSTFAQDYVTAGYMAPTNEDWETISAMVADLEEKLMSTLCEDLIDVLKEQAATLALLQACICQTTQNGLKDNARLPDLAGYVDQDLVTYKAPGATYGDPDDPANDTERCELAQAFYYYVYNMYTEDILPFANATADTIVTSLVATTAFSSLALFIGWPVAVVSGIVLAVVAWGIDGSIASFTNWLWNNRDEIVCVLYNKYPNYDAAGAAIRSWINSQGSISLLDKALLKVVLGSSWHMTWVSEEQQTNGTWDDALIAGQCDSCLPADPGCWPINACDLDDWSGGSVSCVSGRAQIAGGSSRYTANQMTVPITGTPRLELNWYPRSAETENASCTLGLYDIEDESWWGLKNTGDRPIDVAVSDYEDIPVQLWGREVYLMVKQEFHKAEPNYWCISN